MLRKNRTVVFALVLGFLAMGGVPAAQGVPAVTDPTTHLRMPFTGWFDKYGFSPPGSHFTSGDWSTDLYAPPPTTVKAWIQIPSGGTTTLKVLSVGTTCGTAGKTVKLDVYVNGTKSGWMSYGHLDAVPGGIVPGASVAVGGTVGKTKLWSYQAGCWEVTNTGGVHTHFTAYNYHNYACYLDKSEQYLSYNTSIGRIGGAYATHAKQECTRP